MFSQSIAYIFTPLPASLKGDLNYENSNFIYLFFFLNYDFGVLLNCLPKTKSWTFSLIFFFQSFIVLCFIYRSMICLEYIFVCGIKYESSLYFCIWISTCFSTNCWKDQTFSVELPLHLCKKSVSHFCVVHNFHI